MRKRICVFMSEIMQVFQRDCCKALLECARERDIDVFVYASYGSYACPYGRNLLLEIGEKNIIHLPDFSTFDAVIAAPDTFDIYGMDEDFFSLLKDKCTCPIINFRSGSPEFYLISIDNEKTMEDMTAHFIVDHGFTKIYYMSGPFGSKDSPERLAGYKKAMEKYGLAVTPNMIYEGNYWRDKGKLAMDHFLNGTNDYPEAIVCANDYMALSICEELKARGKRVPEDVCVSGVDGIDEGMANIPSLTSVVIDPADFAKKAFEIYDSVIAGKDPSKNHTITGKPHYLKSCGCGKQFRERDRNLLMSRITATDNLLREAGRLAIDYQNNNTLDNAFRVADYYFYMMGCDRGYLCLCEDQSKIYDPIEESTQYTDTMHLIQVMYRDDHKLQQLDIPFERKDILPREFLDTDKAGVYIIAPLHYKSKPYGYIAICPDDGEWINSFANIYINSLSSAIENSYKEKHFSELSNVKKLSMTDPLTSLLNRRGFEFELQRIYNEYGPAPDICIASIDMDGLKYINDYYGHNEGDEILVNFAKTVSGIVNRGEIFARFGGDEFCTVLMNRDGTRKETFESDFKDAIDKMARRLGKPYPIHASIGLCDLSEANTEDVFKCYKIADDIMYERKRAYKKSLVEG